MAKSIQKIQQNLIAIEEKVASLSLDLHQVYRNYLGLAEKVRESKSKIN